MPLLVRLSLFMFAAICGAFVTLSGVSLSYGLEPYHFSFRTAAFWVLAGLAVALPLWLPALIPNRFSRMLKFVRWLGALTLTLPTYLFGSIVTHNISRSLNGLGATPSALAQGLVTTSACVAGLVILLWPELKLIITYFRTRN